MVGRYDQGKMTLTAWVAYMIRAKMTLEVRYKLRVGDMWYTHVLGDRLPGYTGHQL